MEFSRYRIAFHIGIILLSCSLYFWLYNHFQPPGGGGHENVGNVSRPLRRRKAEGCPPGVPLMTPENLTFYLNYPEQKLNSKIVDKVNRMVERMPRKSRTVILDCTATLASPANPKSWQTQTDVAVSSPLELESIYLLFLETIAKYNQKQKKDSIKVWLRLRDKSGLMAGSDSPDSFCTKFAQFGNAIFPGTVIGLLGNLDSPLIAWARHHPDAWKSNLEQLKENGLELGLMLEEYMNCDRAQYLNTENVMKKFSVIYFYSQNSWESWHWRNGKTPTLEAKVPFEKCKRLFESNSDVAEKVQLALNNIILIEGKFCVEF